MRTHSLTPARGRLALLALEYLAAPLDEPKQQFAARADLGQRAAAASSVAASSSVSVIVSLGRAVGTLTAWHRTALGAALPKVRDKHREEPDALTVSDN